MWAVDPETGAAGWYPITWTTKHEDADLVTLSVTPVGVDGEALSSTQEHTIVVTITATLEHPFWVEGWEPSGYWMNAGDLQAGDTLLSADGRRLVVQAAVRSSGPAMVYNFTVDALHTYTVTELRVVVHNVDCYIWEPSNIKNMTARHHVQKMHTNILDHLKSDDLKGAWGDLHGKPVPKPGGGFYNHLQEVNDALKALTNSMEEFKRMLDRNVLSQQDRHIIEQHYSQASMISDYVNKVIHRDEWIDGTTINFPPN